MWGGYHQEADTLCAHHAEEIAADAVACAKAGAAVIHIHVRDENGVNSMDTKRFCQVVDLVREECGKAGVDPVLNP